MAAFVRLKPDALQPAPDRKVLRAGEYRQYADAASLVEAARREAERIRAKALEEAEEEKRRGYEAGLGEARMEQARQMMSLVAANIDYIASVERQMAGVVTCAVRKILGEFDEPDLTLRLVRQALSVVREQKRVTLRLAPNLVEEAKSKVRELLAGHPGIGFLEVVGDHRLQPGACILESELGVVEASLESQLQALEKAMLDRIEGSSGG